MNIYIRKLTFCKQKINSLIYLFSPLPNYSLPLFACFSRLSTNYNCSYISLFTYPLCSLSPHVHFIILFSSTLCSLTQIVRFWLMFIRYQLYYSVKLNIILSLYLSRSSPLSGFLKTKRCSCIKRRKFFSIDCFSQNGVALHLH